MRVQHMTILSVAFLTLFLGGPNTVSATEVTLNLVDQNAQPIPLSRFQVGSQSILPGETISLPAGSHEVEIFPGIAGQRDDRLLRRKETIEVVGITQATDLEWKQAEPTVTFVDQHGVPIPTSRLRIHPAFGSPVSVELTHGVPLRLPITADPRVTGAPRPRVPAACSRSSSAAAAWRPG